MSNPVPVTITGLSTSSSGATILSQAQANQLLQKLRTIQHSNPGANSGGTHTVKIRAIQTNPATGAKQLVAIPITTAAGSGGSVVAGSGTGSPRVMSPMKVIKIPAAQAANFQTVNAGSQGVEGIKVVKLTSASTTASNSRTVISPQVVTPSKTSSSTTTTTIHVDPSSVVESRKRSDIDFDSFGGDAKRRKTEKGGKGLRHFSMKVCEKVQAKGSTSYNEVADELVNELTDPRCTSPTDQQYDQKNIRRRVYDALNVLMAMNIISKEKKEIRWLGLPTNSIQEANGLEVDKAKRIERIKAKTQQLQDLILQQIAFKNLVERNKEREKQEGAPAPNSAIQLPFIIVNTSKKTVIDCSISNDKMEYLFNFDDTFEIHDDMEVLKRMGLSLGLERGQVSKENLAKAMTMVPKALEQYVVQLSEKGPGNYSGLPKVTAPKVIGETRDQRLSEDTDSEVDVN